MRIGRQVDRYICLVFTVGPYTQVQRSFNERANETPSVLDVGEEGRSGAKKLYYVEPLFFVQTKCGLGRTLRANCSWC